MLPIHTRIMITANLSADGSGSLLVSERSRTGEYVVTNEFKDQEAMDIYKKLTDSKGD